MTALGNVLGWALLAVATGLAVAIWLASGREQVRRALAVIPQGNRGDAEAVGDAPDFERHADMAMALLTPDDPALPAEPHLHAVTDKEN